MTEWGSWGAAPGAGGEPPPPTQPWGAAPPPRGPYEDPPRGPYDPPPYQQQQPGYPPPYQREPYPPDPYPSDPYQADPYGQYPSGGWHAGPPDSGRGGGRGPLIAVLALVGILLVGGAAFFVFFSGDDDDDGGDQAATGTTLAPGATTTAAPTTAPQGTTTAPGGEVDVFALDVGNCWDDPTLSGGSEEESISSATLLPCNQPHDLEIFDSYDVTDAEYPGIDAMAEAAQTECANRFEEFVGVAYEDSQYTVHTLTPSQESWDTGDREVLCSVYDQRGKTTGSLAGIAQ